MNIVLDLPPLLSHLLASQLPDYHVFIIDKHHVYPTTGTSIISQNSEFVEFLLMKLIKDSRFQILQLSSLKISEYSDFTISHHISNTVALIYNPNTIINVLRLNVRPTYITNLLEIRNMKCLIIKASTTAMNNLKYLHFSKFEPIVWLPLINNKMNYQITQSENFVLLKGDFVIFDLIYCLKLIEVIINNLRLSKL